VDWHSKYVLPWILKIIGKSDELLLVFSLAWALGLAALVSLPFIGFSLEIGGFLAGLALARSAVHYEIGARIKSLRDFFLIIFFIVLGSGLAFNHLSEIIVPALIVTGFVILIKPLIIMVLVGLTGFKPRTGLMTALPLSQISEFSLILTALGLKLHYIDEAGAALLTVVAILTIITSSYFVMHADSLYEKMKEALGIFDFRRGISEKGLQQKDLKRHVIVVGAHRLGRHIVSVLMRLGVPFVLVDQNPEIVENYSRQGVSAMCGDIADSHIQQLAGLSRARLLISTMPSLRENEALLETIQTKGYKTRMIMAAQDEEEALSLYSKNIDYVLLPHFIGGLHLAKILEDDQHLRGLRKLRQAHLKTLENYDA
jgi:voltage-gated potassium channel Kch